MNILYYINYSLIHKKNYYAFSKIIITIKFVLNFQILNIQLTTCKHTMFCQRRSNLNQTEYKNFII